MLITKQFVGTDFFRSFNYIKLEGSVGFYDCHFFIDFGELKKPSLAKVEDDIVKLEEIIEYLADEIEITIDREYLKEISSAIARTHATLHILRLWKRGDLT